MVLKERPIIYLYHRALLIAHTDKLEGYKQMPDGLVRVSGPEAEVSARERRRRRGRDAESSR